jgi:type IV pilus assembly protein PilC
LSISVKHIESSVKKSRSKENKPIVNFLKKDISLSAKKISIKKKEEFYSELGILLSSGIDLKTAMEIITEEQKSEHIKKIYKEIAQNIIEGEGLSDALSHSNHYSIFEINTIRIGEETSRMIDVLKNLTDYFGKKIKQKRQITNAFSYPVIIILTAVAAIYFMLNFMVPMFQNVFERFNSDLPKLTQLIINLSNYFSKYFLISLVIVLSIISYMYFVRNKDWYRKYSSKLLLKIPFLGSILRLIYLERFFQSMALLSSAKIPLLRSVKLVREMVGFYPFEQALLVVEQDILFGKLLHSSLESFSLIDKKIISLIKVGEETNQLQFIFEKLYNQHAEELEFKIGMISSILEPFIIVFIGLLVGIILISMYLPMFQMGTSIM